MIEHWREGVQEERGQSVQAVEDERIVPGDDGRGEGTHGEGVVHVEPGEVVQAEEGVQHAGQVDHVAKVEHEVVLLLLLVQEVAQHEEQQHERRVVSREPLGVPQDDVLRDGDDGNTRGKRHLISNLDLGRLIEVVPDPLVGIPRDRLAHLGLGPDGHLLAGVDQLSPGLAQPFRLEVDAFHRVLQGEIAVDPDAELHDPVVGSDHVEKLPGAPVEGLLHLGRALGHVASELVDHVAHHVQMAGSCGKNGEICIRHTQTHTQLKLFLFVVNLMLIHTSTTAAGCVMDLG